MAEIRSRCGIGADSAIRHYDVTDKLGPAPYVDGGKWAPLYARICGCNASGSNSYFGSGSVEADTTDLTRASSTASSATAMTVATPWANHDAVQRRINEILS